MNHEGGDHLVADRSWSERTSQRSTRGATNIGRDQLSYTDQRNNPVINNNHRISFNSIQDAVEFAEQRAAPLYEQIEDLHDRLQAADDYADAIEEQLREAKLAWRLNLAQLAIAAGLAFALGSGLVLAFTGGSAHPQSIRTVTHTAEAPPVTETVTAVPSAAPDTFTAMPCEPGKWVAFLATHAGPYASFMAEQGLKAERNRASRMGVAAGYEFGASRWDDTCADARKYAPTDEDTRTFLWTGPFDSKAAAQDACRILRKPASYDCLPQPTVTA